MRPPRQKQQELTPEMWEIVQAGGALMWPIMLCSIVAAAITLERLWTLQDRRVLPPDLMQKVWTLVEAHQINDKVILALEQNSPLGRLLAAGLQNRHRPREILMERLEDTGRHVVYELERYLNTLGTIAGVSPLLGLLGTVTGIIKAFNAINAGGAGDPRLLSGGIAEALVATAAGLCVAIPSLILYRYLRGRVERIVVEMEKNALRLVDAVDAAGRQPLERPAAAAGAAGAVAPPASLPPAPPPSAPAVVAPAARSMSA
jgi:biopolymer transport protein ExbB